MIFKKRIFIYFNGLILFLFWPLHLGFANFATICKESGGKIVMEGTRFPRCTCNDQAFDPMEQKCENGTIQSKKTAGPVPVSTEFVFLDADPQHQKQKIKLLHKDDKGTILHTDEIFFTAQNVDSIMKKLAQKEGEEPV